MTKVVAVSGNLFKYLILINLQASPFEAEVSISLTHDKPVSSSSACFSETVTACDPSTSSTSVFPTSSSSGSPQLNNSLSSPHPGPSPRPSILRKTRDPASGFELVPLFSVAVFVLKDEGCTFFEGNSAAVRRLAFDTPVTRPASCSDNMQLSSGFNDDPARFV